MRLEIITHCYRYSRVLTYQLSSLVLNPPPFDVVVSVLHSTEDVATSNLLTHFDREYRKRHKGVIVNRVPYLKNELGSLLRREIGRNMMAQHTLADIVWFADADYVFGPGCLEALGNAPAFENDVIYHPREVQINKTHALGDEYAVNGSGVIPAAWGGGIMIRDINPDDFMPKRHNFAIGGLQIVTGNTARKHGYCPDDKKLQSPADTWQDTKGDFRYRKIIQKAREESGKPPVDGRIDLPNLYRIRQSVAGEVDTLGTNTSDSPL
ncbi:MAG: glycosyltransferase family 2 protein [Chloroflexi bacterium]|nr:glycosyltransferase family 2 protein [Chloroflexota bacterium]